MSSENDLKSEFEKLSLEHRAAFAASCCERLIPMYQAFNKLENWGNYQKLREYLDFVWEFSIGSQQNLSNFEDYIEECEELIPDSEDFQGIYIEGAQNAAIAVYYAMQICIDKDVEAIVWISKYASEAIYSYLSFVTDPKLDVHEHDSVFDIWISESPLLKSEIEKQKSDMNLLKSTEIIDKTFIENLKKSSKFMGINPFVRGLIK